MMKKLLFILAIIAMTTPLMAQTVDFSVTDVGNGQAQIGYANNGVPAADLPVGIALKVVVTGCEVTGLVSYDPCEFPAYIDYAYTEETSGDGYDPLGEGHPLAKEENAPGRLDTGTDLPATTVYVCMGRVQDGVAGPNPGPESVANLVTLQLADDVSGDSVGYVSVYEDVSSRGGVVGGGAAFATNLPQEDVEIGFGCYTGPDKAEWEAVGSPKCWCCPRQCHGDTGLSIDDESCGIHGSPKTGYWYVGAPDLGVLIAGWKVKEDPDGPGIASITNGICADFDHTLHGSPKTGYWRIGAPDLGILLASWKLKEPPDDVGIPADCLD
jgi:hypothetical protein